MITQEALKKYFQYSPETGEFHRILLRDAQGNETPIFKKTGTLRRDDGYLEMTVLGKTVKNHRLAFLFMTGNLPEEVDHINGDRADNRWVNLRAVDKSTNMKNRRVNSNNTSGTSGITWFEGMKKWRARINVNGTRLSLGLFDTIEEAIAARRGAEKLLGYHENHGARRG